MICVRLSGFMSSIRPQRLEIWLMDWSPAKYNQLKFIWLHLQPKLNKTGKRRNTLVSYSHVKCNKIHTACSLYLQPAGQPISGNGSIGHFRVFTTIHKKRFLKLECNGPCGRCRSSIILDCCRMIWSLWGSYSQLHCIWIMVIQTRKNVFLRKLTSTKVQSFPPPYPRATWVC